jgi:tyrosyl-tRNA synthetase
VSVRVPLVRILPTLCRACLHPPSLHAVSSAGPLILQVVNNYDWYRDMTFLGFLRDVGKHARMGTMLNKDSVKSRLADTGMSFTEFSYQLLQVLPY